MNTEPATAIHADDRTTRTLVFVGRQYTGGVRVERHAMPILMAPERPVNPLTGRFAVLRRLRAFLGRRAERRGRHASPRGTR